MCEFPLAKLGLEAVSLLALIILTKDFLESGHNKSDDHVGQEDLRNDCQAEAQYFPQSRSDQHEQADENNQAQNVGNGFHDYSLMARIVSVLGSLTMRAVKLRTVLTESRVQRDHVPFLIGPVRPGIDPFG